MQQQLIINNLQIPLLKGGLAGITVKGYEPNAPTSLFLPFSQEVEIPRTPAIDAAFQFDAQGTKPRALRTRPYSPQPCKLLVAGVDILNGVGQCALMRNTTETYVLRVFTENKDFATAAKDTRIRDVLSASVRFNYTAGDTLGYLNTTLSPVRFFAADWQNGTTAFSANIAEVLPFIGVKEMLTDGITAMGYTFDDNSMSAAGKGRLADFFVTPDVGEKWQHCSQTIEAESSTSSGVAQTITTNPPQTISGFGTLFSAYGKTGGLGLYSMRIQFRATITTTNLTTGNTVSVIFRLVHSIYNAVATSATFTISANGTSVFDVILNAPNVWLPNAAQSVNLYAAITTTQSGAPPAVQTVCAIVANMDYVLQPDILPPVNAAKFSSYLLRDVAPDVTVQDLLTLISAALDLRIIIDDSAKVVYATDLAFARSLPPIDWGAYLVRPDNSPLEYYIEQAYHPESGAAAGYAITFENDDAVAADTGKLVIESNDTTGEIELDYVKIGACASQNVAGINGAFVARIPRNIWSESDGAFIRQAIRPRLVSKKTIVSTLVTLTDAIGTSTATTTNAVVSASFSGVGATPDAYAAGYTTATMVNFLRRDLQMLLPETEAAKMLSTLPSGSPALAKLVVVPPFGEAHMLISIEQYTDSDTPVTIKLISV